jgi:2-iminobutanoate/2-iminopropanoate deaminase
VTLPTPAGHYRPGAVADGWLLVAGQTGEDAAGRLGDLAEQTRGAVANVAAVLAAHGAGLPDVVRCTCFVVGLPEAFAAFDAAYREALGGCAPARTTVGVVALPAGELVEIEATALLPPPPTAPSKET